MVIRVTEPGRPAFQLRPGEEGISVFITDAIEPGLDENEVLAVFRPGSFAVVKSTEEIERYGLRVISVAGAESLPQRLRDAHAEIRLRPGMSRSEFKQALRELE